MRRLDLKNYTFSVPNQKGILEFKTYNFQKTLEDILPHHGLGLNGPELIRAMGVVEKVKGAKGEVLLTEDDYRLIVDTCTKFRGFQRWDDKFLKRIYRCPVIPDKEFSDNGKEKG
ncbi:hypothetical protein ES695_13130 [Candidatus Atribacteria bacterium 1244-E10-H5-B2]|nr:MAG: hypothetical protein ES695_13130 [Candidatus Atribacteria bacterium 1244-E10-H5-B2]